MKRRSEPAVKVRNGSLSLAVTDIGGPQAPGPALVLMPGLGLARKRMEAVAGRLPGWRVLNMDLRGHGGSDTAPFDFPSAVGDVRAVVEHFGLERPYVGGHSLGGMIAIQYALTGHPVAGVINIDGWGPGIASRYLGEDEDVVNAHLDVFATGKLASRTARAIIRLTRQSREGTTRAVLAQLDRADVVAWQGALTCRSLAFNAIAPSSKFMIRMLGPDMARLQESHRAGLRRDLAALAQGRPQLTVAELDATHALITTHPDEVAAAIRSFHESAA
jgi:pimeloyl-ACP methyl ester carboxylesterase